MSRKAVLVHVLKEVVDDLGEVFATKDVSEDVRMRSAHQQLVKHSHYHAFVGGALSDHRGELNIKEIQKGTKRGSRWQKISLSLKHRPSKPNIYIQENKPSLKDTIEKPFTLVCPSCGGKLQRTENPNRFTCMHCDNEHIIGSVREEISAKPIISEMQHMRDDFLSVQKSVEINNAELAVARINKELSVLKTELHQQEKKGKKDFGPNSITGLGSLAVIFAVFGLLIGSLEMTLVCLSIGLPIMIVGLTMTSMYNKKAKLMKERIASLQEKKQTYLQFIDKYSRK